MPVSTDGRHWTDRHGPLAFAILGCVTLLTAVAMLADPKSGIVIVPVVAGALTGMHYGRERARQNRETVKNEK